MKKSPFTFLLVASAFLALAACASKPTSPKKIVTVETTEPLNIHDGGGSVAIRVNDGSTIIELDKRRFVCRDYAGYIGRVNGSRGWIKVGKLDISYDAEKIQIRGTKSWQTFDRAGERSYFATQDGSVGRSVFKD